MAENYMKTEKPSLVVAFLAIICMFIMWGFAIFAGQVVWGGMSLYTWSLFIFPTIVTVLGLVYLGWMEKSEKAGKTEEG